jgi:hypothetical protein
VQTLYNAHLDPPLLEQIQQRYPHLLEESSLPNRQSRKREP